MLGPRFKIVYVETQAQRAPLGDIDCYHRSRRFQFSLKHLLIALTAACFMLGSWNLCSVILNGSAIATRAVTGEVIRIRVTFVDFSGRECETCFVEIRKPAARGDDIYQKRGMQAKRCWPGFYNFELELPPVQEPGAYRLAVSRMARLNGTFPKTIVGRTIVSAKRDAH